MNETELQAALTAAFATCEGAGLPLDDQQKQILLITLVDRLKTVSGSSEDDKNPLEELTPEQRQRFLQFVQDNNPTSNGWKVKLLNDWLAGEDSGEIQFLREEYGLQWVERVQPVHLAQYLEAAAIQLKVGDRIEVANNLWEWVQDDGPCSREWFPCTVIAIQEMHDTGASLPQSYSRYTNCTLRFDNGMEYEIQGIYEWNRYNWRWPSS